MSSPTTPSDERSWRWTVFALAVLLACASGGYVALRLTGALDNDGPSYPDHWDRRVEPFVKIVEKERDLDFRHPIYVDFLTDKKFRDEVTADEEDLTEEDRKQIRQFTGLLRAVGLVEGEVDLFGASNDLSGAGTLGFYSYRDKRIRIRGDHLTPARKSTLVHELTHALQDQHFALGERFEALDDDEDSEAEGAFRALVEGDARRIEAAYVDRLSEHERTAVRREESATYRDYRKEVADVPQILKTFMRAPYEFGSALLRLAVVLDGNDEVDDLFGDPPTTDENLLDPWTLLADGDGPITVELPQLQDGEESFYTGPFGAISWYLMLAERLPLLEALDAVDGWDGDAMVAFERDGVSCLRANVAAESARDRAQLRTALEHWVAALPHSPASVTGHGAVLLFESCDPGTSAHVGRDSSEEALTLSLARTYSAANLIDDGVEHDVARCFANRYVHAFTLHQVLDSDFGHDDPSVQARFGAMFQACS